MNVRRLLWSIGLFACAVRCGSGETEPKPAGRTGTSGASGSAPASQAGASGAGVDGGAEGGRGDTPESAAGAGGAERQFTPTPYESSCEEQQCTESERCLPGPAGTYCVHECPGQPCPPGPAQVPYCTRGGGVICAND